jgi:pentatricopeptide repeat protein
MDTKDLVSWNSTINSYGINGDGHSALRIFHQLKDARTPAPNAITFVSVISACSHSGLISEGYKFFESMRMDYGIEPSMDHSASVIDLLGRSGRFAVTEEFIRDMPVHPNSSIWGPLWLLASFMGTLILQRKLLKNCQPWNLKVTYGVSLSNTYALAGR